MKLNEVIERKFPPLTTLSYATHSHISTVQISEQYQSWHDYILATVINQREASREAEAPLLSHTNMTITQKRGKPQRYFHFGCKPQPPPGGWRPIYLNTDNKDFVFVLDIVSKEGFDQGLARKAPWEIYKRTRNFTVCTLINSPNYWKAPSTTTSKTILPHQSKCLVPHHRCHPPFLENYLPKNLLQPTTVLIILLAATHHSLLHLLTFLQDVIGILMV